MQRTASRRNSGPVQRSGLRVMISHERSKLPSRSKLIASSGEGWAGWTGPGMRSSGRAERQGLAHARDPRCTFGMRDQTARGREPSPGAQKQSDHPVTALAALRVEVGGTGALLVRRSVRAVSRRAVSGRCRRPRSAHRRVSPGTEAQAGRRGSAAGIPAPGCRSCHRPWQGGEPCPEPGHAPERL